jgi:hypothetical protein
LLNKTNQHDSPNPSIVFREGEETLVPWALSSYRVLYVHQILCQRSSLLAETERFTSKTAALLILLQLLYDTEPWIHTPHDLPSTRQANSTHVFEEGIVLCDV